VGGTGGGGGAGWLGAGNTFLEMRYWQEKYVLY